MSGRRRHRERGFTLLELMVVVLVIGILLGVAVPTFLSARSRAEDSARRASLRTVLSQASAARGADGSWPSSSTLTAEGGSLTFAPAGSAVTSPSSVSYWSGNGVMWAATSTSSGRCEWMRTVADRSPTYLLSPVVPCRALGVPAGVVTAYAGSPTSGYADGNGTGAMFADPHGMVVADDGTVYVADHANNRIRRVSPSGVVTTLAGSGVAGTADGTGTAAQFNSPVGLAWAPDGSIYVLDRLNHRIRKMTTAGVVTTFAGSVAGFADGSGTAARFWQPQGIATGPDGLLYVADIANHRIRVVTPAGDVSTLAGTGVAGFADGSGATAQFSSPTGVAVGPDGVVYVADRSNYRIRRISRDGVVTTVAGSGAIGAADGPAASATFGQTFGIAVTDDLSIYVADRWNHRIRRIAPDGTVSTVAGSTQGTADGTGTSAQFNDPVCVVALPGGSLLVSEAGGSRIRLLV